jgi:hypothetical protein
MIDPRLAPIIAAAGAAAAAMSPQGAAASQVLTALLQAANDFHNGVISGTITDADMDAIIAKTDVDLAGLRADIAAAKA